MKWSDQTGVEQAVIISAVESLDIYDGVVDLINQKGKKLSAYFFGEKFAVGESVDVEFYSFCRILPDWEKTFSQNQHRECRLDELDEKGHYNGYGRILSINPIMVDFGDLILDIGNWTNDERVIGEFIYWRIDRLEVARH